MKPHRKDDSLRREQEMAWIGDTVLDLFARLRILREHGTVSGEILRDMTSNQFLACFGNPTSVEAKIGTIYQTEGMDAAFAWIESELIPMYQKQAKNRRR